MIGWIVLIALPLIAVACFVIASRIGNSLYSDADIPFILGGGLIAIFALLTWISWPLTWIDLQGQFEAHKEIGATLQRARENDWEGFERATLQREVVETNKNLRYAQRMDHYWDPFIPDEIHDLEPVE